MRRCETCIMTRQRQRVGVYLYSWTTNGGERGYIYLCFWNTRYASFLPSSFSAIISVFCYLEDVWWIRSRERWVAKKFKWRFFLLFSLVTLLLRFLFSDCCSSWASKKFFPPFLGDNIYKYRVLLIFVWSRSTWKSRFFPNSW